MERVLSFLTARMAMVWGCFPAEFCGPIMCAVASKHKKISVAHVAPCIETRSTTNLYIVEGDPRLGGLGCTPWYDRVVVDRLAMVGRYLNRAFCCTSLVRLAVERAQTRFGG